MSDDVVAQVKARSPRRVLDDLVPITRALAGHGRARPEIELMLMTGATVRGRFVAMGDDRDGVIVVIQVGGTQSEPSVAFVRVDLIVAVIVPDASLLVKGPTPDQPIPSKLELARQAAAKADLVSSKLGHPVTIAIDAEVDDDGRRAISVALPLLVEVLGLVASDDMGKQALRPITAIELGAGSAGDIGRHGSTLVVRAPKLLTEVYTRESLRAGIEKIL